MRLARRWLLKTYRDRSDELGLASLLQILVGEWISSLYVSNRRHGPSHPFLLQIKDDIAGSIRESPQAVDECDTALVLIGEAILRTFDLTVPEFEGLASKSAQILKSNQSVMNREPNLFPVSYLLESLGFELEMKGAPKGDATAENRYYELSEGNFMSLVNYVSKVTGFGAARFQAGGLRLADETRANLVTLTYHSLLQYKLDEGGMLTRAMNHAGLHSSKPFQEAMSYILAQQRRMVHSVSMTTK